MKKIILKSILYIVLILVTLEIIVRAFHLYTEDPPRYIDEYGVEKRVPNHKGYSVTGNRNQNISEFSINKSGFNSFREFFPTKDKFEVAIIGDSYIEGFHQNYFDSTGKKIENRVEGVEVYEYGYAGYDFANQLHLINSYSDDFDLIDKIIIYLNYHSDLDRGIYAPNKKRIELLSSPMFKLRDNIKLLAYASKIGVLDFIIKRDNSIPRKDDFELNSEKDKKYLENFVSLVNQYDFDKQKTVLLLDTSKTSSSFLKYCDSNGFIYIDFSTAFEKSKQPATLIYDEHWNNHGRELIAELIADYLKE